MRVLVCGSRDYDNQREIDTLLSALLVSVGKRSELLIIHGGASGADSMAGDWATKNGVLVKVFYADWKKYGKAAGPIRNKQMLDEGKPDLVIAFPKNGDLDKTKGTKDMVQQAKEAGVITIIRGA